MNHLSKPSFAASGHPFVLGYVGAVLTASVLVAFFLLIAHEQAERSAVVALRNITDVVEARVDASLRRIQSNLEQLATEIPDAALDQSNVARFLDQINRDLDGRASHFPELSALRIFAANGDKLYESGLALPSYSIADRAYFRSAKANPRQPLIFSEAILSRASKRPIVVIARPLTNPAKQFRGIVVGALEMGYFTDFFSTLDLGAQGSISLRRTEDGGMLARWTGPTKSRSLRRLDGDNTHPRCIRHVSLVGR
ncbi:MAG: cache domain-containing protein [Proteobacteria bacterium]|nr:cache domain-containing protein [Pseudomonadota bacterium]